MNDLEKRVQYVLGFLEALLGLPSIDLSIPAQNRIRYAIRVLKGDVEGAAMMNDPFDVPKVLQ